LEAAAVLDSPPRAITVHASEKMLPQEPQHLDKELQVDKPSHNTTEPQPPIPPQAEVIVPPQPPPMPSSQFSKLTLAGPGLPFMAGNFRPNPMGNPSSALPPLPPELKPLGNYRPMSRKDTNELSQVVITTLPLGWHAIQEHEAERKALEQTQVTVSPFVNWMQRTEDIDAIIKEADKKYVESSTNAHTDLYDAFLGVRYPFTGSQPQPQGSAGVIYSTPVR